MSDSHSVTILETEHVTHNVRRFVVEKPDGYEFIPGQATMVAIQKEGWRDEDRPFTFTSLRRDPFLEFTIKIYPKHDGVTEQLDELQIGDQLEIEAAWGAIQYQGPGTFIAGGAGVTPFISILRHLHAENELGGNRLMFSNHQRRDIIMRTEFKRLLGKDCLFTLTDPGAESEAKKSGYLTGRIDEDFLRQNIDSFDQYFYVCGPPDMVEAVPEALKKLGASEDKIVTEDM